ncbi:molybdenum cofactor guanylyltransferase [Chromatiales bacterium (ex Bugula neritina AB1)]|nr:molybdenum cofactor guanylyltransferase [Chromatiales bacterium (ex Bugula neritina AB1)]
MAGAEMITGVILAGGMGRRMNGVDKGLIQLHGRDLISYVIDALEPNVNRIIVNANRNLDAYEKYGVSVIKDSIEGYQGPLAGVEAGMAAATTPWIYTCPCDSPLQSTGLLPWMWRELSGTTADIGLAFDGQRTHPVFSLVKTGLLQSLRDYLGSGERKIDRWFAQHELIKIDCSQYVNSFININTEEERLDAESLVSGGRAAGSEN